MKGFPRGGGQAGSLSGPLGQRHRKRELLMAAAGAALAVTQFYSNLVGWLRVEAAGVPVPDAIMGLAAKVSRIRASALASPKWACPPTQPGFWRRWWQGWGVGHHLGLPSPEGGGALPRAGAGLRAAFSLFLAAATDHTHLLEFGLNGWRWHETPSGPAFIDSEDSFVTVRDLQDIHFLR